MPITKISPSIAVIETPESTTIEPKPVQMLQQSSELARKKRRRREAQRRKGCWARIDGFTKIAFTIFFLVFAFFFAGFVVLWLY